MIHWEKELNPPQLEAVMHPSGPLLVVAGAGSGKTRVLTYRIAYLVEERGVDPRHLLAVTFTNKAADEMKARLGRMLGPAARNLWVATFHSTGAQILRSHGDRLGYSRSFVIYDEDDSLSLVKAVLKELNLDEKAWNPKRLRWKIEAAKRELWEVKEPEGQRDPWWATFVKVYRKYQERLMLANALDFEDLLLLTLRLLREHPDLLEHFRDRFRHVLVDEYQDTNTVQYLMVKTLAERDRNLMVVGDEDQSIYGWRGADITNLLNFVKDFPGAKVVKLEQNYRSTKTIIEAAGAVISRNTQRLAKTLWTEHPQGESLRLFSAPDDRNEAGWVVEQILRRRASGRSLSDFAVFYRTHAQSRLLEEALRAVDLPHAVYGGVRFYDRKEVKDILAYLRVLANPADEAGLRRIVNTPARGLGSATLDRLSQFAAEQSLTRFEALDQAGASERFSPRSRQAIRDFLNLMDKLKALAEKESLFHLAEATIRETGYEKMLAEEGTIEAEARRENLDELLSAVRDYEREAENPTLAGFLEKVALASDLDNYNPAEGRVVLMTLHSAKGLEFPVVFMVGMEENIFPHPRALAEGDLAALEEERRLCYVGMTRAKESLNLSLARRRSLRGSPVMNDPSRFLDEIPGHLLEGKSLAATRRRAGERAARDGLLRRVDFGDSHLEYDAETASEPEAWDPVGEFTLKKGVRVRHARFGVGVIQRLEGEGDRLKVTVKFAAGAKKLSVKNARLEPVH
jgi:DNA helicase-2/ATP-dependent DNA helicase PcrA